MPGKLTCPVCGSIASVTSESGTVAAVFLCGRCKLFWYGEDDVLRLSHHVYAHRREFCKHHRRGPVTGDCARTHLERPCYGPQCGSWEYGLDSEVERGSADV